MSQSASYSSTAGTLPSAPPAAGPSYAPAAATQVSEHAHARPVASPQHHPASSAAASHGPYAYAPAMTGHHSYHTTSSAIGPGAAGLGIGPGPSAGHPPPDLRLSVPVTTMGQTTSWHQPSAHYSSDLSATSAGGARATSWSFPAVDYMGAAAAPATGMPGQSGVGGGGAGHYPQAYSRMPPMMPAAGAADGRLMPSLHEYEGQHQHHGQPTSSS